MVLSYGTRPIEANETLQYQLEFLAVIVMNSAVVA